MYTHVNAYAYTYLCMYSYMCLLYYMFLHTFISYYDRKKKLNFTKQVDDDTAVSTI